MGEEPEFPPHVLENWADWRLGDVDALVADVRSRCAEAVRAWSLQALQTLPDGNVALVLAARAAGREVVLKLSPRPPRAPRSLEGDALALWARQGAAPAVLGMRDGGATLLLERVRPGESLGERGTSADEVLGTIGALCRRVHLTAGLTAGAGFPSLAAHARDDGWWRSLAGTREHDELTALVKPAAGDRLLHIDLHALNVLRGPRSWLAIDPKPCLGDPCAEIYGFLDGAPLHEFAQATSARGWLQQRLAAFGRASGEDPERLGTWLRVRAQILLGEGAGPKQEVLQRLRDALG